MLAGCGATEDEIDQVLYLGAGWVMKRACGERSERAYLTTTRTARALCVQTCKRPGCPIFSVLRSVSVLERYAERGDLADEEGQAGTWVPGDVGRDLEGGTRRTG